MSYCIRHRETGLYLSTLDEKTKKRKDTDEWQQEKEGCDNFPDKEKAIAATRRFQLTSQNYKIVPL